MRQQRGRAANRTAGIVLIREILAAPTLVEQIGEVDDVETQLKILLSESTQILADADIDLIHPWVPACVAAQDFPSALSQARNAIDKLIERVRLGCGFELRC